MSVENKENIVKMLRGTKRVGVDNLLEYMETAGFFEAPCSGGYHLCKEGGLAEHSLNVMCCGIELFNTFSHKMVEDNKEDEFVNSIIIVSLLHDLGKIGQFGKANYVENILKSGKQSTAKPYETNKELMPVDHEVRSIIIAQQFIELTEEEQQAILWHNGMYGTFKYQIQGKEFPLYLILHFADMWASRVLEKENLEV